MILLAGGGRLMRVAVNDMTLIVERGQCTA